MYSHWKFDGDKTNVTWEYLVGNIFLSILMNYMTSNTLLRVLRLVEMIIALHMAESTLVMAHMNWNTNSTRMSFLLRTLIFSMPPPKICFRFHRFRTLFRNFIRNFHKVLVVIFLLARNSSRHYNQTIFPSTNSTIRTKRTNFCQSGQPAIRLSLKSLTNNQYTKREK